MNEKKYVPSLLAALQCQNKPLAALLENTTVI